jgi:hypothetical protein
MLHDCHRFGEHIPVTFPQVHVNLRFLDDTGFDMIFRLCVGCSQFITHFNAQLLYSLCAQAFHGNISLIFYLMEEIEAFLHVAGILSD